MKSRVPWWAKVAAKLVLSRLPISYRRWATLGIFRHGHMEDPGYALDVIRRHMWAADLEDLSGATVLEVGPGDSLASAVCARALGADRSVLVDVAAFATEDLSRYAVLAGHLRGEGFVVPPVERAGSVAEVLTMCGAEYHTNGLSSLRALGTGSVDLVWSQAVLEHIRRDDFDAVQVELRRLLKHDGTASHRGDLQDHLGHALNNLRFSERVWESRWFQESGFYTNRIRYRDMLDRFEAAGFQVSSASAERWSVLPTPRCKLDEAYRLCLEEDLLVRGFDVVLKPAPLE